MGSRKVDRVVPFAMQKITVESEILGSFRAGPWKPAPWHVVCRRLMKVENRRHLNQLAPVEWQDELSIVIPDYGDNGPLKNNNRGVLCRLLGACGRKTLQF